MYMSSVWFRKKHCEAVPNKVLCFQAAFVVTKRQMKKKKPPKIDARSHLKITTNQPKTKQKKTTPETQKTIEYLVNYDWKVVYSYILTAAVIDSNGRKTVLLLQASG